jgi:glycolate oxidase iron-sulfur subunit
MECVKQTEARAIVTANPGCILQLRAGVSIHATDQEVLHVVELLDRSISGT